VGHDAEVVRPLPTAPRIMRDLPQAIVVVLVLVKLPVERHIRTRLCTFLNANWLGR